MSFLSGGENMFIHLRYGMLWKMASRKVCSLKIVLRIICTLTTLLEPWKCVQFLS